MPLIHRLVKKRRIALISKKERRQRGFDRVIPCIDADAMWIGCVCVTLQVMREIKMMMCTFDKYKWDSSANRWYP